MDVDQPQHAPPRVAVRHLKEAGFTVRGHVSHYNAGSRNLSFDFFHISVYVIQLITRVCFGGNSSAVVLISSPSSPDSLVAPFTVAPSDFVPGKARVLIVFVVEVGPSVVVVTLGVGVSTLNRI